MAKRFIDTNILKHHFLRGLEAPLKLLWMHLLTDCNHAGIWQVDFEIAEIIIGGKLDQKKAMEKFINKVTILKDGKQWFIPAFIEFQYGKLQEKNPAHKNVILILKKELLINENLEVLQSPFVVPSKGTQDKEKEEDKEKEKVKEKENAPKIENLIYPFDSDKFMFTWDAWIKYRIEIKKPYKSNLSIQAALKTLSKYNEPEAIKMIEQSIANQWQGIFEIKNQNNNHGKQQPTAESLAAAIEYSKKNRNEY
jgi:hypothetical protein